MEINGNDESSNLKSEEDPFTLFPELVWENISNGLFQHNDIFNLLTAYPAMDQKFQSKKPLWYFSEVIRIIRDAGYLQENKDLLSCRLVCRRWSYAVDNYLEGFPGYHPFNPEVHDTNHLCRKETLIKYDGYRCTDVFDSIPNVGFLQESYSKHLQDFQLYIPSCTENKFPSTLRRIYACPPEFWFDGNHFIYNGEPWTMFEKTVKLIGKGVWALEMDNDSDNLCGSLIADLLRDLPNLKHLSLTYCELEEIDMNKNLPRLQNLESLRCNVFDIPRTPRSRFLDSHCEQLRLLSIPDTALQWLMAYATEFRSLSELEIVEIRQEHFETLKLFLDKLSNLHLARCRLDFERNAYLFSWEGDLFQWLQRFPQLRSFRFDTKYAGIIFPEKIFPNTISTNSFPFLTYLQFQDNFWMSHDYLTCFPSLRYLSLTVKDSAEVWDHSIDFQNPNGVRIKWELLTGRLYDSNVWELLKRLKMIYIDNWNIHRTFDRSTYELLKWNGKVLSPSDADYFYQPLRRDLRNEYHPLIRLFC